MSAASGSGEPAGGPVFGISGRLMLLTLCFVMLAEILILVPSIANFRNTWLSDRLAAARTAALVLEASPGQALPEVLIAQLLDSVGSRTIAHKSGGVRRLLAVADMPQSVAHDLILTPTPTVGTILEAFDTLFHGGDRLVRVMGLPGANGDQIEMVMEERPLRQALLTYTRNILLLSLLISSVAAALMFFSLHRLIVKPVKRLAESISSFGQDAEDSRRVIRPSGRSDEIGQAEKSLAGMQRALNAQLKQQQHLAALGLAVAKINHDLRNMLSSAHLLSDRLAIVPDPTVQRIAPKLVRALDRAIGFCQATLAFGRAQEQPAVLRSVDLAPLVQDLRDLIGIGEGSPVGFASEVPPRMTVSADPDQLLRVLLNISRNAVEAMMERPTDGEKRLTVSARKRAGLVEIDVADTGPGIPSSLRDDLFKAFAGSRRPGGTGLGLAIAADLMRAQGGSVDLIEVERGACFRLTLPE